MGDPPKIETPGTLEQMKILSPTQYLILILILNVYYSFVYIMFVFFLYVFFVIHWSSALSSNIESIFSWEFTKGKETSACIETAICWLVYSFLKGNFEPMGKFVFLPTRLTLRYCLFVLIC